MLYTVLCFAAPHPSLGPFVFRLCSEREIFCLISIESFLFVFSSDCSFNFHSSQTFLSSLPGLFSWSQTQKAEITLPVCKKEKDN